MQLGAQNLYDQYYMMGRYSGLVSFAQQDTVTIAYPVSWKLSPIGTLAFICDKTGSPQFYCNGAQIGNILGDTLIAEGMIDSALAFDYGDGMPMQQGAIILPKNDCQYYCIYFSETDSLYQYYQQVNLLYYALVDMCSNGGKGKVVSVKNLLYNGIMGDGRMTACKHANGRDWWLVVHGFNNNEYIKFLATPDSITGPYIQRIGANELQPDILGQAVFSPDGLKYASITGYSPLILLDFDRCTGEFSNPVSINVSFFPPYQINSSGGLGCCFSPSGRFVYINEYDQLIQYDLFADTIQNSAALIAQFDTTYYKYTHPFHTEYLAPNGKIYIDNWDGSPTCYHVINAPDSLGAACNYDKAGFCPDNTGAYPISNMPHYRLGPLVGSGCDTLTEIQSIVSATQLMRLRPNPASDKVLVSLTEYMKGAQLQVIDILGKIVYENKQFYLGDWVDVGKWANGGYMVRVSNNERSETVKLIKQ
jgi:hypothetical protein